MLPMNFVQSGQTLSTVFVSSYTYNKIADSMLLQNYRVKIIFNTNIIEANSGFKKVVQRFPLCLLTFLMRQRAHRKKTNFKQNTIFCCCLVVLIHESAPYKFSFCWTHKTCKEMPECRKKRKITMTMKKGNRQIPTTDHDQMSYFLYSLNAIKTHWLAYLNDNRTVKGDNNKNLSST